MKKKKTKTEWAYLQDPVKLAAATHLIMRLAKYNQMNKGPLNEKDLRTIVDVAYGIKFPLHKVKGLKEIVEKEWK
jgi:hypothetical protein